MHESINQPIHHQIGQVCLWLTGSLPKQKSTPKFYHYKTHRYWYAQATGALRTRKPWLAPTRTIEHNHATSEAKQTRWPFACQAPHHTRPSPKRLQNIPSHPHKADKIPVPEGIFPSPGVISQRPLPRQPFHERRGRRLCQRDESA